MNERRETCRAIPTCSSWYPNYGCLSGSALILAKAARRHSATYSGTNCLHVCGRRWSS